MILKSDIEGLQYQIAMGTQAEAENKQWILQIKYQ